MTSKISLTKITQNFIKQNSWLMLTTGTLTALCTIIPLLINFVANDGNTNPYYYLFGNTFLFLIALGLGFLNSIVVFKYLNSKTEVDFYHSLPITRTNMFIMRYISGIIAFVLPFIIVTGITALVGLGVRDLDLLNLCGYLLNAIIIFLSTYAFTTLGGIITGNIFMTLCVSLGFMNFPWVWLTIFNSIRATYLDFFYYDGSIEMELAKSISPIGAGFLGTANFYYSDTLEIYWSLVLVFGVISVISYLCYKKRHSENSSNPVAINTFKHIIKFIGVISASSLGGLISCTVTYRYQNILVFLFGAFITGFIVHIAFEILYELDVKAGLKRLYHFGIIYALLSALVIFTCIDVFGFSDKTADIGDIKSIDYCGIEITNPESIEILHTYMQASIDVKNNKSTEYFEVLAEESKQTHSWILLTVNLKNGTSYTRQYDKLDLALSHMLAIESDPDFVKEAYNYDYEISKLEEILKSAKSASVNGNVYFDISAEKFLDIYKTLQTEVDLLTPEYLANNIPVITISIVQRNNSSIVIPVFDIQKETLDKIEPISIEFNTIHIDKDYNSIILTDKQKEIVIENMITSYGAYYSFGYMHRLNSNVFNVYNENYNIIGYISEDIVLEIVEEN